ncbi:MAG TPA: hypothetical protein VF310_17160 [Vicinamibacteria bacterium]
MADRQGGVPQGVWAASGFFALAGVLEIALAVVDRPATAAFWPLWEAAGRGALSGLVAWGLWHRLALCRTVAILYCLAMLITYVVVVGMALAGAPARYSASVVVGSLYHIPSCALLLPYLRSSQASLDFARPLLGGGR